MSEFKAFESYTDVMFGDDDREVARVFVDGTSDEKFTESCERYAAVRNGEIWRSVRKMVRIPASEAASEKARAMLGGEGFRP